MFDLHLQYPAILWGWTILPLYWLWLRLKRRAFRSEFKGSGFPKEVRSAWHPMFIIHVLRSAVIALLIFALAGPRTHDVKTRSKGGEGIEIVIAIDISTSMLARDFRPDRLEATKRMSAEFVQNRPQDKIGLVLYAGESFTKTPPTSNHALLLQHISEITYNMVEDGTAIGMGLATAVNRLRKSEVKSKVVILLSDGENNRGTVDPLTAAELAAQFGIRVYTIGVGSKGSAPTPYAIGPRGEFLFRNMPVSIDEELLKNIAEICGGKYFRATEDKALKEIYAEIDALERTKLEDVNFVEFDEKQFIFIFIALLIFVLEMALRKSWLKSALDY
jgi:Ca-activated chloride channel family protein